LGERIASFSEEIRGLSHEALQEIDFGCWPDDGMAPAEEEPHARTVAELAEAAKLPPPVEGTPWSSFYRANVLLALARLRAAVDLALAPITEDQVIGVVNRRKGGAPLRLAWFNLAWRLGGTIERHLGEPPNSKSKALFERTLAACLTIGLQSIKSKRAVPNDLRNYTKQALRDLAPRPAGSLSTASTEKTPHE
jgi:hypothetical protein